MSQNVLKQSLDYPNISTVNHEFIATIHKTDCRNFSFSLTYIFLCLLIYFPTIQRIEVLLKPETRNPKPDTEVWQKQIDESLQMNHAMSDNKRK